MTYHVRYTLHGAEKTQVFDNTPLRAMFVVGISPYAVILEEWIE